MKKNIFVRQLGEYFDTFLPDVQHLSENTIAAYADAFAKGSYAARPQVVYA